MTDRQGIEIDYCPKCRGVWLDKGELDKIIERSANYSPTPGYEGDRRYDYDDDDYKKKNYPQGGQPNDPNYKHRKKRGFLGDFFDFD